VEEEKYKPNSHRSKEAPDEHEPIPDKKITSVVKGGVTQKKKSAFKEIIGFFAPEDELTSFKDYVILFADITSRVYGAIDVLLGNGSRDQSRPSGARVSYRSYYDKQDKRRDRDYEKPRTKQNYNYDDIIFDNRGDAEMVLRRMEELLETFNAVSIADMFDLCDITAGYTMHKYGWTDLDDARVRRVNGGYIIDLPKAIAL